MLIPNILSNNELQSDTEIFVGAIEFIFNICIICCPNIWAIMEEKMKKIVLALAALSSISFVASASVAQTANVTFSVSQVVPLNGCQIFSNVTVNSSTNYTLHTNGVSVTGPGFCSTLLFADDMVANFGSDPTSTLSTSMTISDIRIFTPFGDCDQPAGTPSGTPTPPSGFTTLIGSGPDFIGSAAGYVFGTYMSNPYDCFFDISIEFDM